MSEAEAATAEGHQTEGFMPLYRRWFVTGLAALMPATVALAAPKADPREDQAAIQALNRLTSQNPAARQLAAKAAAVLVFPRIVKVGFLLGGAYGEGAMIRRGRVVGYYNSAAASYGLQAGAQWFGYALFLMTDKAMAYLNQSSGFELGVGPSVVVVDAGMARRMTSSTLTQDIYAIIFNQKGMMAGLGIEGSKITKI
ncbi:MAG TPA: lipid-binding SYLF domain-containing protein [Acetobacteraceae bacterium]|nr:lipid-binding SYLF domain-containing protein [Acetobacteraceae bacterium]